MFFFSSRRRHTRYWRDWSSDVCSSDLRKRELVDEVTIGLVKHSVAEETRVYPRVEEQVDREEAEHSKHEHAEAEDRKSTRLNSSHANISYAVFCLKKKILLVNYSHPTNH